MSHSHTARIVVLIDMDCFYCQVEEQLDPNLQGKPIAVVQYNQWKGGGIIAVNYIARDKGVTRQMRGDEAKLKCPEIELPRVPQVRGKADLTKYREAGKKVADVLMTFTSVLERASIDEAYLDLTEAVNNELEKGMPIISLDDLSNTFVVGSETTDFLSNIYQNQNNGLCDDDLKLAIGSVIVEKIRAEVFNKTGFKCSAGIAHNKTLAKLVCGLHKPNKQTILPQQAVPEMFSKLPVRKIKSLGGKFGNVLSEVMKINCIGELVKFSEKELMQAFDEKTGKWLYNISRGIDKEPVQIKLISKSIGCCKRFPGRTALCKPDEVEHWIKELSCEISERLEEDLRENNRRGRLMTVSFAQEMNQNEVSSTRAVPLKSHEVDKIYQTALDVLKKNCQRSNGSYHVTFLGLSIGNFENIKNVRSIESFFGKVSKDKMNTKSIDNISTHLKIINEKHEEHPGLKTTYGVSSLKMENNMDTSVIANRGEYVHSNKVKSMEDYVASINEVGKNKIENSQKSKHMTCESPKDLVNYITENLLDEEKFDLKEPEVQLYSELDIDKKTNYSDSTISLDENPNDLIFYDDGFRCEEYSSFNDNTIDFDENAKKVDISTEYDHVLNKTDSSFSLKRNTSISSIGSLENERYLGSTSPVFGSETPGHGFFTKHLEHHWERDFDTSKILLETELTDSETTDDSIRKEINFAESPVRSELTACDLSETCIECGDSFPITEIVSHMDYHLALKISKENSPLRKRTVEIQKNRVSKELPKKRKAENAVKKDIISFFKKEEFDPAQPSELCLECKKNIKLTDLNDHNDYHAAKKLHLELNKPVTNEINITRKSNDPTSKMHSKQKVVKHFKNSTLKTNIISFFKKK